MLMCSGVAVPLPTAHVRRVPEEVRTQLLQEECHPQGEWQVS